MNKRIKFGELGLLGLTQEHLEYMQDSYRGAFGSIARLCGNKSIISGCVVTGNQVSAGWIAYEGELAYFAPGTIGAGGVVINEIPEQADRFQSGGDRTVRFTKVASPGTPALFNFSELKRLTPLRDLWCVGDVKEVDCDAAYWAANFDNTGLGTNERVGWAICNGQNGTRDRRGRVSVGFDVEQGEFNEMGETGGEKQVTLSVQHLPAHQHETIHGTLPLYKSFGMGSSRVVQLYKGLDNSGPTDLTSAVGGNQAHNNLQPYITTLFIQKIF